MGSVGGRSSSGDADLARLAAQLALIAAYCAAALFPLALAAVYAPGPAEPVLKELGKGAGLVGLAMLTLQVPLAARLKFLDRLFGLGPVMRFHRRMALVALALLALHPALLAIGSGNAALLEPGTSREVNLGKAALLIAALSVALALLFRRLRLPYHIWRILHKGAVAALVVGFAHAEAIGPDLQALPVRNYLRLLVLAALAVFLWRNVLARLRGRRFRVASVRSETHDTYTLELRPEGGSAFPYEPGQFIFLRLLRPGRSAEEHPFTISSSPTQGGRIAVTVKGCGDYTRKIGRTRPGDEARVEGPFGRFSYVHHDPPCFLFIAGGVGITPIMSMLRCLRDRRDGRTAVLIYGCRTERDIIFREELDRMLGNVSTIYVLSEAGPDWHGERGLVTGS